MTTILFKYGVASGDPLADKVIIWTHAKYENLDVPVIVKYEVAQEKEFLNIVSTGFYETDKEKDFTVKIDVQGLLPNTYYYYRFYNYEDPTNSSTIGRTRTIPDSTSGVSSVSFAVASCSNYPQGYFNVYQEIAQLKDINAVIFLGDYIYEYGLDGYDNEYGRPVSNSRIPEPKRECFTLDDYRKRHATYKTDTDLQYVHSLHPMIPVWDDHEVADNAWEFGCLTQPPGPAYELRKADGLQAYHEWVPIRTTEDPRIIFRTFDFGNILSLHMLDTRHYRRNEQIYLPSLLTQPEIYVPKLYSESRELLGKSQLDWLAEQMAVSDKPWQVLGQQVVMANVEAPVSILIKFDPLNFDPVAAFYSINEYLLAKGTPENQRSEKQKALLNPLLNPVYATNLDAWGGYPAEREKVFKLVKDLNKKLVVLSGDSHMAWYNDLVDSQGEFIGKEIGVTSVSSRGPDYDYDIPPEQLKNIYIKLFNDVKWVDTYRRGYSFVTFTENDCTAEWRFINRVDTMYYKQSKPTHVEVITK